MSAVFVEKANHLGPTPRNNFGLFPPGTWRTNAEAPSVGSLIYVGWEHDEVQGAALVWRFAVKGPCEITPKGDIRGCEVYVNSDTPLLVLGFTPCSRMLRTLSLAGDQFTMRFRPAGDYVLESGRVRWQRVVDRATSGGS